MRSPTYPYLISLPTHNPLAVQAASRLAFARLAFDTAENEFKAQQVAMRVIAGAAADLALTAGRRPCFLVERCAGSKARFQVPVGKK